MKKGIVLILLLSLLYQLVGYMALFSMLKKAHHSIIHKTLKHQIPTSNLVILKFSAFNFNFNEYELVHNGHFYDIVKTEIRGNEVYVYCYDDKDEKNLTTIYETILFENLAKDVDFQQKTQSIFKFFIKEFLFERSIDLSIPKIVSVEKQEKIALFLLLSSIKMPCLTPPPEFYFS
ncbi:MAG: hypothetical protein RIS64_672 [Bacteroidota bacterium]|jgi:hypothetical protein